MFVGFEEATPSAASMNSWRRAKMIDSGCRLSWALTEGYDTVKHNEDQRTLLYGTIVIDLARKPRRHGRDA